MKKIGTQTIKFETPPYIVETSSIVGPKEAGGPLAKYFDQCLEDEFWGEKTWEKAESKIIKETVNTVISKSGVPSEKIDYMFPKNNNIRWNGNSKVTRKYLMSKKTMINQHDHYRSQILPFSYALNLSLDELKNEIIDIKDTFCQ